jgi:DNA-binding GntR family transcriptional regulator
LTKISKKEFARNRLRNSIVSGGLRLGQRIPERIIAEEYGLSRVPVREALIQLERDGLVEIRQGHGAYVRQFSRDNIQSLYQFRESLEGMAAKLAAERMPASECNVIRLLLEQSVEIGDAIGESQAEQSSRIGAQFHTAVINASYNSMIIQTLESIKDCIYIAKQLSYVSYSRSSSMIEIIAGEHLGVIDAISKGKSKVAENRMRKHVSSWASIVLQNMQGDVERRQLA